MPTDRYGDTSGQKCAKGGGEEITYNSLCVVKIQRMWGMKCMVIP